VDWAIIVPTAITGAVGLAGIGGTLLSARMTGRSDAENLRTSISAEDERAKLAEKRRVYASCLASLTATGLVSTGNSPNPESVTNAFMSATCALFEVRLIAPREVGELAGTALGRLLGSEFGGFADVVTRLTSAMRADLGEPD